MTTAPQTVVREAWRLSVRGVVQGVGFRPFVHRLALRHGLGGWVRNAAGDVQIEIEGAAEGIGPFMRALKREAPPLARIERVEQTRVVPTGLVTFEIRESADQPDRRQPISPDVAICHDCLAELSDPTNRRYHYPFITCTDCGPRFTVIEAMPYDRERTSMRAFPQCPECRREYEDPSSRRFHSETNSCPDCGPHVWLTHPDLPLPGEVRDPIATAARLLQAGLIIAVRGLGGFHLAVDATNDIAVRRLRARKLREAKPLAVMVRGVEEARAFALVGGLESALLESRERPIVLLRRRVDAGAPVAPTVAPGLDTIGVMLAYTPMHHLLLERTGRPLVMTSGNRSEEPIATSNEDALRRLDRIADAFLVHDREIVARYDDSVLRVAGDTPVFLRRARGFAPLPIPLPLESPTALVAVGPHLKNTFTLVHESTAYVSQHVGDLENLETLEHFQATLALYRRLFRITPTVAARDLHPGYLSTRVAEELGLERVLPVQHHHAHVAAVLAEHGETGPALGLAFDGTGYGEDGNVWGAEFLIADLGGYRRVGQLRYAALPGGDLAVRRPWRVARGYLALAPDAAPAFARAFAGIDPKELTLADQQIAQRLNAPLASSLGRLFDAAAAVLGIRTTAQYEGQAAMELEALAGDLPATPLPFPAQQHDGTWELDPLPLLTALGESLARGEAPSALAAAFHESVAAGSVEVAVRAAQAADLTTVVLGGGCFQNARLLASLRQRLTRRGLRVLIPRLLSPNDGAISYGQAAIATARLRREADGGV